MQGKKLQQAIALMLAIALIGIVTGEVAKPAMAAAPLWLAKKAFNAATAPVAKKILEDHGYIVFQKPWYIPIPKVVWYVLTAAKPVY